MPDPESKKYQHKKEKNDPKQQRIPRQQRNQGAGEKKPEKRIEEPKVPAAVPEKQAFKEPGPEFYKGLKRETDEILKITEDANSKYKKKEIKSNWSKYEVPIESYDEIEEQENLGADYEKLIQAPQSLGGHFQFKHEKSWDITIGPSLYHKYFDITTSDLATALCTIPFYERNGIDKSIFSETDLQTMDQRTSRYKHKYFKIATTESEIQDKLINSIKEDYSKTDEVEVERKSESEVDKSFEINFEESKLKNTDVYKTHDQVEIVFRAEDKHKEGPPPVNDNVERKGSEADDSIDDIILETTKSLNLENKPVIKSNPIPESKIVKKDVPVPTESNKKPVIESPEDLEKWLDDFLEE